MFLTLLQSGGSPPPPPPPPPSGGGPGGPGSRAHEWELELQRAARLAAIGKELARSESRQAKRIARKLEDYTGELKQAESLRRELAKLEAAQREQTVRTQLQIERDRDLQAAVNELNNLLIDDEDAIAVLIALEEFETRLMLAVVGIKLH
jgi:hypothetical protein